MYRTHLFAYRPKLYNILLCNIIPIYRYLGYESVSWSCVKIQRAQVYDYQSELGSVGYQSIEELKQSK